MKWTAGSLESDVSMVSNFYAIYLSFFLAILHKNHGCIINEDKISFHWLQNIKETATPKSRTKADWSVCPG
jgi:hypothetical protein